MKKKFIIFIIIFSKGVDLAVKTWPCYLTGYDSKHILKSCKNGDYITTVINKNILYDVDVIFFIYLLLLLYYTICYIYVLLFKVKQRLVKKKLSTESNAFDINLD